MASPFIGLLGPLAAETFLTRPRSFYRSPQGLAYIAMTFGSAFAAGTALALLRDANFSIASAIRYACAICTCYIFVAVVIMAIR